MMEVILMNMGKVVVALIVVALFNVIIRSEDGESDWMVGFFSAIVFFGVITLINELLS